MKHKTPEIAKKVFWGVCRRGTTDIHTYGGPTAPAGPPPAMRCITYNNINLYNKHITYNDINIIITIILMTIITIIIMTIKHNINNNYKP